MTVLDGIVVIGGDPTGVGKFYTPAILDEIGTPFTTPSGDKVNRLVQRVLNLDNPAQIKSFLDF